MEVVCGGPLLRHGFHWVHEPMYDS